jgi:hypothetical protein
MCLDNVRAACTVFKTMLGQDVQCIEHVNMREECGVAIDEYCTVYSRLCIVQSIVLAGCALCRLL